jgi:hypothetical protein
VQFTRSEGSLALKGDLEFNFAKGRCKVDIGYVSVLQGNLG